MNITTVEYKSGTGTRRDVAVEEYNNNNNNNNVMIL